MKVTLGFGRLVDLYKCSYSLQARNIMEDNLVWKAVFHLPKSWTSINYQNTLIHKDLGWFYFFFVA